MTGLRSIVQVGLTGSRWLLPWISIVLVSAALTYAMNGALTGWWATPQSWPAVSIAPPAAEVRAADTAAYEKAVRDLRDSCTSLFGSYNYWLFSGDREGPCGLGPNANLRPAVAGDGGIDRR